MRCVPVVDARGEDWGRGGYRGDREASRLTATRKRPKQFVLCVRNDGCEDLELRKLYPQLSDAKAAASGYVRVIDESGEDYRYPASLFVAVELTSAAKRAAAKNTLRRRCAA
jgi:hypothetical protein